MALFDSSEKTGAKSPEVPLSAPTSLDVAPALGVTPPQALARDAAAGQRGAAWRLMVWIIENDPRAIEAVSSLEDNRLAKNLLEFIALGTWAGKPFVVPGPLRSPYARTRLRTLFVPPAGIPVDYSEPVLLAALEDGRPAMRESAMYILGIMGSQAAIPALIAALHDPAQSIRLQAVKALGRTGSLGAVQALLNALRSADEQLSSQIFMALVSLGYIAVPTLLETSKSSSGWLRWHSIRALGAIRDQRALPTLVHALGDSDHSVAWMAAKGLAPFGRVCIEPVLSMLATAEVTPWLVETSSYVLQCQFQNNSSLKPYLDPVIRYMHQPAYRAGTGLAAQKALEQLKASGLLS